MADRNVVMMKKDPIPPVRDPERAWVWIGRFGTLLAAVGLADFGLGWYPFAFGATEWEFGTVASTFAGLPLVTMGMAGVLGAGLARGRKVQVVMVSCILLTLAAVIGAALLMFLTDVPIALKAVNGPALLGIKKAAVKTVFFGVAFGTAYLVAGVGALRQLRKG